MILAHATEAVCHLLPYFALAALFTPYFGAGPVIAAVLSLVFITSPIMDKYKNKIVAVICGLIPVLGLFAAKNQAEILFTLPALIFWFVLAVSGKRVIYYMDLKYWFGFCFAITLIMLIISLSRALAHLPASRLSILLATLHLILGVLVLRRKRMGSGATIGAKILNPLELVGTALCGILACTLVWNVLVMARKLIEVLLLPFGMLINLLTSIYIWLTIDMTKSHSVEKAAASEASSFHEIKYNEVEQAVQAVDTNDYSWTEGLTQVLIYIFVFALLVLLIYIMFRLLVNVRTDGYANDPKYDDSRKEALSFGHKRRKKRSKEKRTNNYMIREVYREYLSYIKKKGIKIASQNTSEEILTASKQLVDSPEASALRALYIRARYNDVNQLSDEEVLQAKKLWDTIRDAYEAEKNNY